MRVEQLIDDPAAVHPDTLALCMGTARLTYRQLRAERDRRAAILVAAGIRAGDRIVVAEQTSPDLVIDFLACCQVGATFVTFSPLFAAPELAALTMRVRPALVLTADGQPTCGDQRTNGLAGHAPWHALICGAPGSSASCAYTARYRSSGDPWHFRYDRCPPTIGGTDPPTVALESSTERAMGMCRVGRLLLRPESVYVSGYLLLPRVKGHPGVPDEWHAT